MPFNNNHVFSWARVESYWRAASSLRTTHHRARIGGIECFNFCSSNFMFMAFPAQRFLVFFRRRQMLSSFAPTNSITSSFRVWRRRTIATARSSMRGNLHNWSINGALSFGTHAVRTSPFILIYSNFEIGKEILFHMPDQSRAYLLVLSEYISLYIYLPSSVSLYAYIYTSRRRFWSWNVRYQWHSIAIRLYLEL